MKLSTGKLYAFRALAALFVFVLSFAIAELGLRVHNKLRPSRLVTSDKIERYRGRPGDMVFGHKLDPNGFKDKEYSLLKPPGAYRILAIGDSFVYGVVPYPDNFLTLLEDKLNSALPDRNIEVLNMGIVGTEPTEYHELLIREGFARAPDMVMVFFFVGNDIILFLEHNMTPEEPPLFVLKYLESYYKLFSAGFLDTKALTGQYDDNAPTYSEAQFLKIQYGNAGKYIVMQDGTAELQLPDLYKYYAYNMDKISKIKKECDDRGVEFLLVIVPEQMQVEGGLSMKVMRHYYPKVLLDFNVPSRMMAEDLARMRVKYLDLLGPFRAVHDSRHLALYKPNDGHWNLAGNRLASEVLFNYLSNKFKTEAGR